MLRNAQLPHEELESLFHGYGYDVHFVEGDEPDDVHQRKDGLDAMDTVMAKIKSIQENARRNGFKRRPLSGQMIVLRTPKGWTRPENRWTREKD